MSNEALLAQRREMRQEIEQLTRERDAALADLSQARSERDNARQEFEDAHAATLRRQDERDSAVARAEAAETQAAAMREVIEDRERGLPLTVAALERRERALASDAGRALLERHAAALKQNDEDWRNRANAIADERDESRGELVAERTAHAATKAELASAREEIARLREDKYAIEKFLIDNPHSLGAQLSAIKIRLGRAGTALQEVAAVLPSVTSDLYAANVLHPEEIATDPAAQGRVLRLRNLLADIRAILADPTAQAAAESYRAQQEERAELEALAFTMRTFFMYGPTGYTGSINDVYRAWERHETRLHRLKVDARRGGGGEGAKRTFGARCSFCGADGTPTDPLAPMLVCSKCAEAHARRGGGEGAK